MVRRRGAVRPSGRRLVALAEPSGDLVLVLDLLRRRVPGATGQNARHDGARRGRGGDRLDLLRRRDAHGRGRRLLRGGDRARGVRAPGSLVRDARPRRCERCHPRAARPCATDGAGDPSRRERRGDADRRRRRRGSSTRPPRHQDRGRWRRRVRRRRRRRVDGHGREPPGAQGTGCRGHRRDDQHERHAAGSGHEGRVSDGTRADRAPGPRGAELEGTRTAARGSCGVLARLRCPHRWCAHLRRVVGLQRPTHERGSAVRHHRRRHHLPGRPRARDADRDHDRHGTRRAAGRAVQERDGDRDVGSCRHCRDGQDRHPHQGRTRSHRRDRRWDGRERGARARSGGRARVRASARRCGRRPRRVRRRVAAERSISSRTFQDRAPVASVEGRTVLVGNARLMEREHRDRRRARRAASRTGGRWPHVGHGRGRRARGRRHRHRRRGEADVSCCGRGPAPARRARS